MFWLWVPVARAVSRGAVSEVLCLLQDIKRKNAAVFWVIKPHCLVTPWLHLVAALCLCTLRACRLVVITPFLQKCSFVWH